MGKKLLIALVMLLGLYGSSDAQTTAGTVNSKTWDGVGNKITSTTVGADQGLDVNCLGLSCTGGSGGSAIVNNDGACPSGAANFTVAASNTSRTWLAIWADPNNNRDVFVKLGVTATAVDARLAPGQGINFTYGKVYTGQIDAFPASGTQGVCLMELN
jgi:hypothetical protein